MYILPLLLIHWKFGIFVNPTYEFCNSASMARKIYLRGGIGVGAFRRIYGGSKRNGSRPPHFCKSSGSIARHILQQLQTMNIIELDSKGWVPFALNGFILTCNRDSGWLESNVLGIYIICLNTWSIWKKKIGIFLNFSFRTRGRRITSSGQRDLDQVAGRIAVAHWEKLESNACN